MGEQKPDGYPMEYRKDPPARKYSDDSQRDGYTNSGYTGDGNSQQTRFSENVESAPAADTKNRVKSVGQWFSDHRILIFLAVAQLFFLIFIGTLSGYDQHAQPYDRPQISTFNKTYEQWQIEVLRERVDHLEKTTTFEGKYAVFQDVHVMIFIGFAYLMTFLRRYGYSAVAMNFLLAALAIEWHTILWGFFVTEKGHFSIGITELVLSDFCAGSILISMGAVLGKISPLQYLVFAFMETIFYTINEYLVFDIFKCNDVGGSMNLHAFGAYFGLVMAWLLYHKKANDHPAFEATAYYSDMFSMLGTLFLWMFWPSFNSAIAVPEDAAYRAVVNTYYSLTASCLITFLATNAWNRHRKFDMDFLQNATLAGGVAVGSAANTMLSPFGAMLVGCIAGTLSVAGFHFLSPALSKFARLHDTCGVHNLHGIPGILGGIVGIIMAGTATTSTYGNTLYTIWPARGPKGHHDHFIAPNRSAGKQAAFQFVGLVLSISIAIIGGAITGLILRLKIWQAPKEQRDLFNDSVYFEVPDDFKTWQDVLDEAEEKAKRQKAAMGPRRIESGVAIGV